MNKKNRSMCTEKEKERSSDLDKHPKNVFVFHNNLIKFY